MRTFINSMMYAGLEKAQFNALLTEARDQNRHYLTIYSSITAMLFSMCLLVSMLAGGKLVINRPVYTVMILVDFVMYFCAQYLLPRRPELSTPFAIFYVISLYAYSFSVSLLHTDMAGAAAVAILLVMPSLFNYRPLYMIGLTIAAQVVYCLLSAQIKEPAIALLDLWNCLFFGSIAVLLSVFQMRVKFRLLLQKSENRRLSETDMLTGVKNRNCFESRQNGYAAFCRENLSCVYVDANGLHELNDAKGHSEGDRMLQTLANAIGEAFGRENTYRIGGDEFVAFCPDIPDEALRGRVAGILRTVTGAGYSASVGTSRQDKGALEMRTLIKQAEGQMYEEKRRYYQQAEHDRRGNRRETR